MNNRLAPTRHLLKPMSQRMKQVFAGSALEAVLAARGESLAAFDERCIPAGGVAPPSNTPGILSRRALPAGRLARLGATPDFHHGLLGARKLFRRRAPRARRNRSESRSLRIIP